MNDGTSEGMIEVAETVLLSRPQLEPRLWTLSRYAVQFQPDVCIAIPTASFIFAADLMRQEGLHDVPLYFIQVLGKTENGDFRLHCKENTPELNGKRVLLLDSCLDSGQTIALMKMYLNAKGISSLCTLVAVHKNQPVCVSRVSGYLIKMEGWAGNPFIFGYGMDRKDGTGRGLPYIGVEGKR